jgi:small subunit ribosomal protein S16
MSVVIRLRRAGSKKRPFYHVVVADSRMRRDGRFIERVGYYNPIPRQEEIVCDDERIQSWIEKGAKPTTTVDRLLKRKRRGIASPSAKDRRRLQAEDRRADAASKESAAEASTAGGETKDAPAAAGSAAPEQAASSASPDASGEEA